MAHIHNEGFCIGCNPLEDVAPKHTYLRSKADNVVSDYLMPVLIGLLIGVPIGVVLWALENYLTLGGI